MKSPRDYAREYRAHQAPAAYARYCPACGGFGVPQNQDACRGWRSIQGNQRVGQFVDVISLTW